LYAATAERNTSLVEDSEDTKPTKHNDQQQRLSLTRSIVDQIVNNAVQNVKENKVFNADLRAEFSQYEYIQHTNTEAFSVFKALYDGYLKNGDTETLYTKYYAQVPVKSAEFFLHYAEMQLQY